MRGLNHRGRVPRFSQPAYGFKSALIDDDIKKVIRRELAVNERGTTEVPTECVNASNATVDIDDFFVVNF